MPVMPALVKACFCLITWLGEPSRFLAYLLIPLIFMNLLISWLTAALAIQLSSYPLAGVKVKNFGVALLAAAVLAIVNIILKPILIWLTLPFNLLTLGLFTFVINGLLILIVAALVPGFQIKNFWWALLFSLLVAAINSLVTPLLFRAIS